MYTDPKSMQKILIIFLSTELAREEEKGWVS